MSLSHTTRFFTNRLSGAPRIKSAVLVRCRSISSTPTETISTVVPSQANSQENKTSLTNVAAAQPSLEPPVDHSTSCYSPMAMVTGDRGPNGALAANVVSGAPVELQSRTVRIYRPTKPATQSGNWNGRQWRMDWDVLARGHRWENQLMGWQSSGDFMQGTHIFFKTKEDAINFADKQGYDWYVQEPNERMFRSKAYAANFTHSPNKLKIIRTK